MKSDWQRAQQAEIDCWLDNQTKIITDTYQRAKRVLWQEILGKLDSEIDLPALSTERVLEFGCGPTGVFMLIDNNPNYLCLDPLMDGYLANFPTMQTSRVQFINSKLEDFKSDQTFNIVLGFNAIDHVDNIHQALTKLRALCGADTQVVLSVNVHLLPAVQRLLSWAYPLLDKLHKHQYTSAQYRRLFEGAGFRVVQEINLDPELYRFETTLNEHHRPAQSWRKWVNPAFWFFQLFQLFGYPRHLYQNLGGRRALYAAQCYLLTPISND